MNEIPGYAMRTNILLQRGVTAYELEQPQWRHPYHGVARPYGPDETHPLTRILDAEPLLPPCGCLGGWASMYVAGVAGIDGLDRAGMPRDVLLHTCDRHRVLNRPGIEPTRTRVLSNERCEFDGHRVTTIARGAYDEMCRAPSLTEAVVIADVAVSRVSGGARTTIESLRTLIERHRKTRGIRKARTAVELACDRSASQLETRTRLIVVPDLPGSEFVANRPVFDPGGRLLGIPDLLDIRSGLVVESDGAPHANAERRSSDHQRDDLFESHGLTVARVTSQDHGERGALIHRLRLDRQRGLARHRTQPVRWTLEEPDWWRGSALAARWG